MALAKHHEEILMRRRESSARIVDEFLHPHEHPTRAEPEDYFQMAPDTLATLREFVQRTNKECEERLAREMVLVFKLNEERTRFWTVGYMAKGHAARVAWVPGGDLLDLNGVYGGVQIFHDHLFITENKVAQTFDRYGSDMAAKELIDRVVAESLAA